MKIGEHESESFRSRLDAISREHGLTRWIGAGLFAALAGFLAWNGLPSRSLIRTECLELHDRQGRKRAELGVDREHGIPHLILYDPQERAGFSLIVFDNGSTMTLAGPNGALLTLDPSGPVVAEAPPPERPGP